MRFPKRVIVDFIVSQLKKEKVRVVKEVFVPDGLDIYVSSRKFLRTLGAKLKAQFGGSVSFSPRLHTQDKSTQKGIYRVALLYKAPQLQKGDIILYKEHVIRAKNVAKFVTGVDISTGKQLSFLWNPTIHVLPSYESRVVKIFPALEVLHPQTYQPVDIANPKPYRVGEKVKIVQAAHKWYII